MPPNLTPQPVWDDLDTTTWDLLFTWDDPMANERLNDAYALGSTTHDGPILTVDWGGGEVTDGLESPIARDLFDRVVATGWGNVDQPTGQVWTVSASGNTSVDGSNAKISTAVVNTAYDEYLAGVVSIDFDVAVKFSIPVLTTGAKASFYIWGRATDTSNGLRYRIDFNTDQIVGYGIESVVGGVATTIKSGLVQNTIHTAGQAFWLRAQGYGSIVKIKAWRDGDAQPFGWIAVGEDTVWIGVPGFVGVRALLATGNTNTLPVVFTVYEFRVGLNNVLDVGQASTGLSLDDGMPPAVTNTSNLGVNEAKADLAGPIGVDPGTYYSTFRTDQPWWDVERDVAGVVINATTLTDDGVRSTRVFTGQMIDVPTRGKEAKLEGLSKTRLLLSTQIQPPAVHTYYEGCEATWALSYAMFKSGVYVAPPPLQGCRLYVPFHGSTHAFVPDTNGPNGFGLGWIKFSAPASGVYQRPEFVDGPYLSGIRGQMDATSTTKVSFRSAGFFLGPGDDMWSQASNRGRIEFWIRGDPHDAASSLDPTQANLFRIYFANPLATRFIQLTIPVTTRQPRFFMKDGTSSIAADAPAIPTDGKWHFVGLAWDVSTDRVRIRVDGNTDAYLASPMVVSALPVSDDVGPAALHSHLPISELTVTTGTWAAPQWGQWANDRAADFKPGVVMRRSILQYEGLAEKQPREAFEYITSTARSEMARVGFNADDQLLYLPLPYWTESAQQLVTEVLSTADNLGDDLDISRPTNKIYNQITANFQASAVQEIWSNVISTSELIQVGPLQQIIVDLPLTTPMIEIRGFTMSIMSGTALAAAPPSVANAINYITMNRAQDGTDVYATGGDIAVSVASWTPGSVQISIRNNTNGFWYAVNNVNYPAIGIAGKAFISTSAAATADDLVSIALRGTRVLTVDLPTTQSIPQAQAIANELVARLSRARLSFTSSVFGDPRRYPGQLVTVQDPDGTQVNQAFRLVGVTLVHNRQDIQQAVAGEEASPVMVWGSGVWGESLWGAG